YNQDYLFYSVRPGDLVNVPGGNQTVLSAMFDAAEDRLVGSLPSDSNITPPAQAVSGNNQWTEITFPISALTRIGGDQTRSLARCSGMRFQINVANNCTFRFGSLWVGGGSPPDVGADGDEYRYLCVPMNSNTGVMGNPTPLMRYGLRPR